MTGVKGAMKLNHGCQAWMSGVEALGTNLSTRSGKRALYASKINFPTLLTSALASRAVNLITSSMSRARVSFSISGGLKQFRQARTPSAATKRREADFGVKESARYGRMEVDCVFSIAARMHAFARLVNTLLVRPQSPRRVGMNSGTRGSNEEPRPVNRAFTSSIVEPDSLLRSEFIAWLIGLESERIPATISVAKSHPPLLQQWVSCTMPCSILSHDSSVSSRETFPRTASSSAFKIAGELHCWKYKRVARIWLMHLPPFSWTCIGSL